MAPCLTFPVYRGQKLLALRSLTFPGLRSLMFLAFRMPTLLA